MSYTPSTTSADQPTAYNGKISGSWYQPWYVSAGGAGFNAVTAARLYAFPIFLQAGITISAIGTQVGTATASEVCRVGIYNDTGNHYPGTLLAEVGTIDLSATGVKQVAASQAISTSGLYWLAGAKQGPTNTATVLYYPGAVMNFTPGLPVNSGDLYQRAIGFYQDTVTGSLPTTFSGTVAIANNLAVPILSYKVA